MRFNCKLVVPPSYIHTFYCLLDLQREGTKRLRPVLSDARSCLYKTLELLGYIIVVKVRAFEEPVWQVRYSTFNNFECACICNFRAVR